MRLGILPGSQAARDVARLVVALVGAPELPTPEDVARPLPEREGRSYEEHEGRRLLTAFVRRVPGRRFWVWYRVVGEHVELVAVSSPPPPSP